MLQVVRYYSTRFNSKIQSVVLLFHPTRFLFLEQSYSSKMKTDSSDENITTRCGTPIDEINKQVETPRVYV